MNTIENAKEIISSYKREDGKKLRIMEVCGTHTHVRSCPQEVNGTHRQGGFYPHHFAYPGKDA